jgi:hypothetical protein
VCLDTSLCLCGLGHAIALGFVTMASILRKQDICWPIHMHWWCLFLLSFAFPLSFHSWLLWGSFSIKNETDRDRTRSKMSTSALKTKIPGDVQWRSWRQYFEPTGLGIKLSSPHQVAQTSRLLWSSPIYSSGMCTVLYNAFYCTSTIVQKHIRTVFERSLFWK